MKVMVLGASPKEERYSNKAMKMLQAFEHDVVAIGGRENESHGIKIYKGFQAVREVATITMYLGEDRQAEYYGYIIGLAPKRIIFNPGAENAALAELAKAQGIEVVEACTLVMLRTGQF